MVTNFGKPFSNGIILVGCRHRRRRRRRIIRLYRIHATGNGGCPVRMVVLLVRVVDVLQGLPCFGVVLFPAVQLEEEEEEEEEEIDWKTLFDRE